MIAMLYLDRSWCRLPNTIFFSRQVLVASRCIFESHWSHFKMHAYWAICLPTFGHKWMEKHWFSFYAQNWTVRFIPDSDVHVKLSTQTDSEHFTPFGTFEFGNRLKTEIHLNIMNSIWIWHKFGVNLILEWWNGNSPKRRQNMY